MGTPPPPLPPLDVDVEVEVDVVVPVAAAPPAPELDCELLHPKDATRRENAPNLANEDNEGIPPL
jgi:hypothetical protein